MLNEKDNVKVCNTGKEVCMKRFAGKVFQFGYFALAFFVLFQLDAKAYIDPSATTYIVQAVAAVIVAIGAAFTIFRHKIIGFFKKNSKKEEKREIHLKDEENESSDE